MHRSFCNVPSQCHRTTVGARSSLLLCCYYYYKRRNRWTLYAASSGAHKYLRRRLGENQSKSDEGKEKKGRRNCGEARSSRNRAKNLVVTHQGRESGNAQGDQVHGCGCEFESNGWNKMAVDRFYIKSCWVYSNPITG